MIYIVSGLGGAGKTTVTSYLTTVLDNCIRLHGDPIHMSLMKTGAYTWEQTLALTWEKLIHDALELNQENKMVLIDFIVESEYDMVVKACKKQGTQAKLFQLIAHMDIIKDRLIERGDGQTTFVGNLVDYGPPTYLERSIELLHTITSTKDFDRHILDTSDKTVQQVAQAIADSSDTYLL